MSRERPRLRFHPTGEIACPGGTTRRALIAGTAGALASAPALPRTRPAGVFDELPNFCSHEHWGSIRSIGMVPEGFRADVECGATPSRPTGLLDLLVDPYARGWLTGGGTNLDGLSTDGTPFAEFSDRQPWHAYLALRPALRLHQSTGVHQCVRRGILRLYGTDLNQVATEAAFRQLNEAISQRYARLFRWHRDAMRQAGFSELIRIVHPEFYGHGWESEAGTEERAFTRTILRIDPFLDLWRPDSPRRAGLATLAGVDPVDAASWRRFLGSLFGRAAARGALGIKQLQAYRRPLEFLKRDDAAVTWRGDLDAAQVTAFQDWVVHECCRLADERGWAHQVHVGTHNLGQSSPLPLQSLARRYGRMRLVMIHCWPFLEEAGWLAKHVPNMHIDTCWLPILNPRFLDSALSLWQGYVPTHKVTCGHDATSVEMAAGSSLFTRESLGRALSADRATLGLSRRDVLRIAAGYLHNNAVALYGTGTRWTGADG